MLCVSAAMGATRIKNGVTVGSTGQYGISSGGAATVTTISASSTVTCTNVRFTGATCTTVNAGTAVSTVNLYANGTVTLGAAATTTSTNDITVGGYKLLNTFLVSTGITSTLDCADAENYGTFFIAPWACTVVSVSHVHTVAGGANSTLQVYKVAGGSSSTAAVSLLAAAFALDSAAYTAVKKSGATLTATPANLTLAAGDRLILTPGGSFSGVKGICVTVEIKKD